MFRSLAILCFAVVTTLTSVAFAPRCQAQQRQAPPEFLTIGSKAPAIDVEHWLQDGNGFFKPIKNFENGKVYVVEFWATWCGPCVSSMPTLAELQNKYRGRDVQIVSVSTEPVETIREFLERPGPEGKSFGEITSAYCLTTDPDESTYRDYMAASGQNGIPAAFIVGKNGMIEWAGHPMLMDEPLESVLDDTWDRAAFKLQYEDELRIREVEAVLQQLFRNGRIDTAVQLIQDQIPLVNSEELKTALRELALQTRFEYGLINQETLAFYGARLKAARTDPNIMAPLVMSTVNALEAGPEARPFADEVIKAYETTIEAGKQKRTKAEAYQIVAMLHERKGDLDKSVAAMQNAVDAASGSVKRRFETRLQNLKALAKEADAK